MKTFEITIKETITRWATVEIEAEDWEQAEDLARAELSKGTIDLEEDTDENLEFFTEEV